MLKKNTSGSASPKPKTKTRKRKRNDNGQSDENFMSRYKTHNRKIQDTESSKDIESNVCAESKSHRKHEKTIQVNNKNTPVVRRKYALRNEMSKNPESENTHNTNTRKRKREDGASKTRSTRMRLQERIQNESPNKEFIENEIVLATIPGFCPWPARILNITGQTISIEFFGTGQM